MELHDIVRKLIGSIEPVGDSAIDGPRLENLKAQIDLMRKLHFEVDGIAYKFKNNQQHSMKVACKVCNEYLDELGIEE